MAGLIVSFGSTPTKRLTLFLVNNVTHVHATTPFVPRLPPPISTLLCALPCLNLMYSYSYYPASLLLLNSLKRAVSILLYNYFIHLPNSLSFTSPSLHETPSPQQLL